jgi:CRISPR-associated protein Cmr1
MLYGGIEEETKNKIVGILKTLFPHAKIYLYGSRARGNFRPYSDIDLALDNDSAIERLDLGEARSVLEALNTPYKVDLVDINYIADTMRTKILSEGKLWCN